MGVGGLAAAVATSAPSPRPSQSRSQLALLLEFADGYDRDMNLYTNNCRVFCCRVQREVERLNADARGEAARPMDELAADVRLWLGVASASMLPMMYPAGIAFLCWGGLRDIL